MSDSTKQYAWYIEGNEIALLERDVNFDNNVDSKEFGPGTSRQLWKSPQSTVADGLQIKYSYSPNYEIYGDAYDETLTHFGSSSGYLYLKDNTASYTNYDSAYGGALNQEGYFVLTNAGKWNGLHKIKSFSNSPGTNNMIITYTRIQHSHTEGSTGSIEEFAFEETPKLWYYVNALEDESFELDLPNYLQKALIYHVKSKMAEDTGNLELSMYFIREFRKMVEKYE